jgi:geranylgeranyl reductase family protein
VAASGRADTWRATADPPILAAIGRLRPNVGTVVGLTSIDCDVLVVGAGPAGVAAGIEAHHRGLTTVVVDRAGFPRDKTCGDGLTAGALRLLDRIGFDARGLASWAPVTDTVLVSPSGREVVLELPRGATYAGVVPRVELDAALVEHARARGVEVRERAGVTGLRDDGTRVTATLSDHSTLSPRWVIAADGHYSPVRHLLSAQDPGGSPGPRRATNWHAFRQYFTGVADRRLWVSFEQDLLPGYAWVFPVGDGRANVGFGVLRDQSGGSDGASTNGKALARQWRSLADRPSIRRALGPHARPEGTVRAWPIPATYDRTRLAHGRVLFAGDAAHVVDPMTGEGIAQALESGALAARAIATTTATTSATTSPDLPAVVAERYRRDVDRVLGADLRFAALLQHLLRVPIGARAAIAASALTPWTRRNFARWMWEDYPRALVLTPSRWRRDMFGPAPPYSLHSSDGRH